MCIYTFCIFSLRAFGESPLPNRNQRQWNPSVLPSPGSHRTGVAPVTPPGRASAESARPLSRDTAWRRNRKHQSPPRRAGQLVQIGKPQRSSSQARNRRLRISWGLRQAGDRQRQHRVYALRASATLRVSALKPRGVAALRALAAPRACTHSPPRTEALRV